MLPLLFKLSQKSVSAKAPSGEGALPRQKFFRHTAKRQSTGHDLSFPADQI